MRLLLQFLLTTLLPCQSFLLPPPPSTPTVLYDQRLRRDMDERSRANAQGGGMGETAAGAVLGGLLFGPFGTK